MLKPEDMDFERLEREVVERIRALAAMVSDKIEASSEMRQQIWTDLVLPNIGLLAEFCSSVTIKDGE